jgi:uncharacterized protein (TIGR00369 family)
MADHQRTYAWSDNRPDPATLSHLSGLEIMQALLSGELVVGSIHATLGFTLLEVEAGRVVFGGTPQGFVYNPIGSVHGGYAATLLDSAVGCAVYSMLKPGQGYTTLDLHVNYVRGLTDQTGEVRAEGKIIHAGRLVATAEGRLVGPDGKLYAHATTTCMIFGK